MAGAKLTSLSHLGLAIEATLGTPVAATGWVPILKFNPQDIPKYVPDTGFRGQATKDFGQYLGVESATYDTDAYFYPSAGGNFLAAVLGKDTVTGTAAPYTHTFTNASYLPSYTISDTYVAGARQFPGCRCEKTVLKFTPEEGLSVTSNFLGFPSVTYTSETTFTYGTNPFFLGWEAAIKLGGTADANLSSCTVTISRDKSKVLWSAADSKLPYDVFVGPTVVSWDVEYYMVDDTEYTPALTESTETVAVTFTQPGTSDTLEILSSAVQWTKPTINRSQDYVTVKVTGDAIYNSTDGGPVQAILTNAVSTSYATTAVS
ncbi:MAG: phage tail tube protein [Acidobacteriaceae bacterium]